MSITRQIEEINVASFLQIKQVPNKSIQNAVQISLTLWHSIREVLGLWTSGTVYHYLVCFQPIVADACAGKYHKGRIHWRSDAASHQHNIPNFVCGVDAEMPWLAVCLAIRVPKSFLKILRSHFIG